MIECCQYVNLAMLLTSYFTYFLLIFLLQMSSK
jgi:hypothetical protein